MARLFMVGPLLSHAKYSDISMKEPIFAPVIEQQIPRAKSGREE